jgi:hypothetical protein
MARRKTVAHDYSIRPADRADDFDRKGPARREEVFRFGHTDAPLHKRTAASPVWVLYPLSYGRVVVNLPIHYPKRVTSKIRVRVAHWLFVGWSGYLAFLLCAFYANKLGIGRQHLESGWLIEAALALANFAVGPRPVVEDQPPSLWPMRWLVAITLGQLGAFLLYGRILNVGLLADDFVLLGRATTHTFWHPLDLFFRPLPLVVWAAVAATVRGSAVAWALHGINVGLHGLNATFVTALAHRLRLARTTAFGVGLGFLCFPAHVEAVAWPAGIQDVMMTTAVLCFLLLLTSPRSTLAATGVLVALGCALLTKETAVASVALGALLLLSQRPSRPVRAWPVWAASCATAAIYVGWRIWLVGQRMDNGLSTTRRGIKRFLTEPFGTLASPWNSSDLSPLPVLGLLSCLVVLALVVTFVVSGARRSGDRRVFILLPCVLAAVAPVGRYFFVSADLEGSRYLYLPCVFWVLFLGYLVEATKPSKSILRALWLGAAAAIIAAWTVGTIRHQTSWQLAGETRDRVLAAIRNTVSHASCPTVVVDSMPDNVDGAYVFRSGLPEAIDREGLHTRLVPAAEAASDTCRVVWSQAPAR